MLPLKELMESTKRLKPFSDSSSIGYGGTSATLFLEATPTVTNSSYSNKRFPKLFLLSANTKNTLEQRVSEWLLFLKNCLDYDFSNIVQTAALRSTHHNYRLAFPCESLEQSFDILTNWHKYPEKVKGTVVEGYTQTIPANQDQKLVFVFSGSGTQWWGMGRHLMQTDPTFRKVIEEADKLLNEFGATWSLRSLLTTEMDTEYINRTEIAQPSICALQIALAEVYRELGVLPEAVIGSSLGEVAAACVAGYLSFRDTMKLVYIRSRSLECMTGKGDMTVIFLKANEVREKLLSPEYKGKVDIACVNSPSHTVITGYVDELSSLVKYFESQGTRCVNLKLRNAFHSFQQEEIKDIFLVKTKFLQNSSHYKPKKYLHRLIPMISTVNGEFVSHGDLHSNQYWWKNIRQPVELERSLRRLFSCGYNVFLEIGPHPYYSKAIRETLESASQTTDTCYHAEYAVMGSLRRSIDRWQIPNDKTNILMSIAKLYVQGYPLDLEKIFTNEPFYRLYQVPTEAFPWQGLQ